MALDFKFSSIFSEKVLAVLMLTLSVLLNVFLGLELKKQKEAVELLQGSYLAHELTLGKVVSPLTAENSLGELVTIVHADKTTVLYVYSPDCNWCHRNSRNIQAIHEKQQNNFRFVGLSLLRSNTPSVVNSGVLPFETYFNPPDASRMEYDFRSTPATYVISTDGKIIKVWFGAYNEQVVQDIEDFFDVKLPGLLD